MTAFESGELDRRCFTSGIEIAPSWAYSLTSVFYLWNQIKFYRVKGEVSESEERESQMKKKYIGCTVFLSVLGICVIGAFTGIFIQTCHPISQDQ